MDINPQPQGAPHMTTQLVDLAAELAEVGSLTPAKFSRFVRLAKLAGVEPADALEVLS